MGGCVGVCVCVCGCVCGVGGVCSVCGVWCVCVCVWRLRVGGGGGASGLVSHVYTVLAVTVTHTQQSQKCDSHSFIVRRQVSGP